MRIVSYRSSQTHLELADALELHRLAREVFPGGDRVREDVQQERTAARRVDPERDHVAHHRLFRAEGEHHNIVLEDEVTR